MLRSLDKVTGYTIRAKDGDIGKVHDFLFDDRRWTIRYLVVDTGNWLSGRHVLLSTIPLGRPDWTRDTLPVLLTRWQVEHSPNIDIDKPVSRQMETELHTYYGWPPYWSGTAAMTTAIAADQREQEQEEGDPHLRSMREVIGYHIGAEDGEIGHVEDIIASDEDWTIRSFVVDTRNWLPGRKVLVPPFWITDVKWAQRKVAVNLTQEAVENSPEYDPSRPINVELEAQIYDYYGRPQKSIRV